MKLIIIAFLIALFSSCTPKDPNPELSDPIFADFRKELDLVNKNIEAISAEYEDRVMSLKSVVPQSGQLKAVQKKVFDSKNNVDRLKQQKQFFEIKAELRKKEVHARYLESFKGGRPWPDPKEIAQFAAAKKLQKEKLEWERNKGVIKPVPRGTNPIEAIPKKTAPDEN